MLVWRRVRSYISRVIGLGLCSALFGTGLLALGREAQAARVLYAAAPQRALVMRQYDPGWQAASTSGLTQLMRACAESLLGEDVVRLSPRLRDEIAGSCRLAVRGVLRQNPSFARALAVDLLVAQPPVMAAAYAQAQAAAPFEPWPLQIRILAADRLARMQATEISPDFIAVLSKDLLYLIQVAWGQDLLRQLYAQDSPLRPLIQGLAQQQPDPPKGGENG